MDYKLTVVVFSTNNAAHFKQNRYERLQNADWLKDAQWRVSEGKHAAARCDQACKNRAYLHTNFAQTLI